MQSPYTKLNFPPIELKTRRNAESGALSVWVATRKCYLVLTPEEWVRRHVVSYLTTHCAVPPHQICEEYPVKVTGQAQRADVVVVSPNGDPTILVECKASSVDINKDVFAQAVRYNSVLGARYLILTNGLQHFCFECTPHGYRRLEAFPTL